MYLRVRFAIATLSATGVPNAFAFDASGNIYVAFGGATVEEHAAGTHRLVRTITGFHHVNDIAVDAKGILYVVDGPNTPSSLAPPEPSNFTKTMPGSTSPSAVLLSFPYTETSPSLTTFTSLVVTASGSVYVGATNASIYLLAPGATAPTLTYFFENEVPTALALDRSGNFNIYGDGIVGGEDFSNVYQLAPGAKTPIAIQSVTFGTTPQALGVDVSNGLYVMNNPYPTDLGGPIEPGSVTSNLVRAFNFPVALAVDPVKNLYVLDADSVMGAAAGPGEHVGEYAYSSVSPTRTFESSLPHDDT